MGKQNIFDGIGKDGFSLNYMLHQAEFLKNNPNSDYVPLSDQINIPFNEYISWFLNFGIVALVTLIIGLIKWFKNFDFIYEPNKVTVLFVFIFAFFSYPFQFYFVAITLIICFSKIAQPDSYLRSFSIFEPFYRAIILVFIILSLLVYKYAILERFWAIESKNEAFEKSKYSVIEEGLNDIPEFHHDFAFKLYELGLYGQSIDQIKKYVSKKVSYDVTNLKALNYLGLKNYEKANESFVLSSKMIPSRFFPKYDLFKIYTQFKKNRTLSLEIAREIDRTPVKIRTPYSLSVKYEAHKYLNDLEKCNTKK